MRGVSILDRHLAVALLGAALLTGLVLLGLSGFVTFVEELDGAERHGLSLADVGWLTLLKLPELLFEMFPLIVLLGAILGLGGLAAGGELVVMQAAGMPVWRIAVSAAVVGLALGVLSLVVGDRLLPLARAEATQVKSGVDAAQAAGQGLWLREGVRFVRIDRVAEPERLEGLTLFELDAQGGSLIAVESARSATFENGRWQAADWSRTEPGGDRLQVRRAATQPLALEFGPGVLELFLLQADSLSLPGLHRYIQYLDRNKLDAHRPRLEFWRKVATPMSVVAMVLIAVPFVLGPLRDTGAGQRLFVGVLLGIGFYVFNETILNLGAVYRWPPTVAALAPVMGLSLLAFWRLQRYRAR